MKLKKSDLPSYKTNIEWGRTVEVKIRLMSIDDETFVSEPRPFVYRGTPPLSKYLC